MKVGTILHGFAVQRVRELDELHRMVDGIPPEILQAAKQVAAHKPQER